MIYIGLVETYKNQECTILRKSRRKSIENYKVQFNDEEILGNVEIWFLKTPEEYQALLEQREKEIQNKINNNESYLDSLNNYY